LIINNNRETIINYNSCKFKRNNFKLSRDIIYETSEIPEDYGKSIIIPHPKKAAAKKCEEFRTINHASKILTKVIFQLIEARIE